MRRAAQSALVLWAAVSILFAVFFLVPGDRVDQVMAGERVTDARARAATEEKLGLDRPAHVQYGKFWAGLARGDLGTSFTSGRPVADVVKESAPASARLAFWAFVVELVAGVATAVAVVAWRRRAGRFMSTVVATALLAAPVFVIGVVLQLALGVYPFQNGWPDWARFAVQGIGPDEWAGVWPLGEQWRYLVLPALTLGLASGAVAHRITREAFAKAMASTSVVGARLRGVPEWRVVIFHAGRHACVPVLAFVAIDAGALFGSAVVTEAVFGWPGIGGELAKAIARSDAPVMLGVTVLLVAVYGILNLFIDVAQRWADPRTRRA